MLSLSAACGALAEDKYMTLELKDGGKYSFLLKDNPIITYENKNLVINSDDETSFAIEDIKEYRFTAEDEDAVWNIYASAMQIVSIDDETIEVKNINSSLSVNVTSVSGVIVSSFKANADGSVIVKLPREKGVYILSAGNQSFKIIRK